MTIEHPVLQRLTRLYQSFEPDGDEAIGLLLYPELRREGYDATPESALTFARTGGDGVHYSFLTAGRSDPLSWPVVMTVPMQWDDPNIVVGIDLREFLALGLRIGYFVLEQLAYDRGETIALLDGALSAGTHPPLFERTLGLIAGEFSIAPWPDHGSRLTELEALVPLA
jgi:hypothetical protein